MVFRQNLCALAVLALLVSRALTQPDADRAKILAEINKWGGQVEIDHKSPGRPIIAVNY